MRIEDVFLLEISAKKGVVEIADLALVEMSRNYAGAE